MLDLSNVLNAAVTWSVCVEDSRDQLARQDPDLVLPIGGVGKVILLCVVADQLESGTLDPTEVLRRDSVAPVRGAGMWQHLHEAEFTVDTCATLVGLLSDNLATNVLIQRVGLPALADMAARLRLRNTTVHDLARDDPAADEPSPVFATSCASDLVSLMKTLRSGHRLGPRASARVVRWLAHGSDHSMVLRALGLDPLTHGQDNRVRVWHTTGAGTGVRATTGIIEHHDRWVAYGVIARWDPAIVDEQTVLASMNSIGEDLATHLGIHPVRLSVPRIYHVTERTTWRAALAQGWYDQSTRDRGLGQVGFIHCSTAAQWPAVRTMLYPDAQPDLVLLEIDPKRIPSPVRYEPGSPQGPELFPHVYGPIPTHAVIVAHDL